MDDAQLKSLSRRGLLGLLACAGLTGLVGAREEPRISLTWLGGPTMMLEFGTVELLTDPVFGESFAMGDPNDGEDHLTVRRHRRLTPLPAAAFDEVDRVLLSHAHEDHLDQAAAATLIRRGAALVVPHADMDALNRRGFRRIDALRWGEARLLQSDVGRIRILAVPARHSRDTRTAAALGAGNGYWLEFMSRGWRRTLYWTGDTLPTPDVISAVRALGRPDILVPHVGGVGRTGPFGQISMGASDVVAMADALGPRHVVPIHHSTYAFYREPIGRLARLMRDRPYRLEIPVVGRTRAFE